MNAEHCMNYILVSDIELSDEDEEYGSGNESGGSEDSIEVGNRGSYMSAIVLLNLYNELGKRDKMWGLQSILSLFHNKLNKFNKTRARMLDSIYHMALRSLWNLISVAKTLFFCHYVRNVVMDVKVFPINL